MRSLFLVLALTALSVAFVACGDDDDDATNTPVPAGEATTVDVELKDYEFIVDPESGPPGDFDFQINNSGPSVHEFVVARTELDATDLPTDDDGAVSEDAGGLEVVDEAEDVEVDAEAAFTANLSAGHYVFFCNIVEEVEGSTVVHYKNGMRGDFTVE
jgi:hypothetical protein